MQLKLTCYQGHPLDIPADPEDWRILWLDDNGGGIFEDRVMSITLTRTGAYALLKTGDLITINEWREWEGRQRIPYICGPLG